MHMLDPRADDLASASLSEQRTAAYAHGREITEEGGCNISARGLIAALHLGEIFQTDPVGAGFIDNGARPGRVCGPAHIAVGHGVYDQTRWAEAP
jgi:hypothetical protein